MGELLDALNSLEDRAAGKPARQRFNEAIEALQEPGMPLEILARATRRAPLHALAVAFLVGVLATRRR